MEVESGLGLVTDSLFTYFPVLMSFLCLFVSFCFVLAMVWEMIAPTCLSYDRPNRAV